MIWSGFFFLSGRETAGKKNNRIKSKKHNKNKDGNKKRNTTTKKKKDNTPKVKKQDEWHLLQWTRYTKTIGDHEEIKGTTKQRPRDNQKKRLVFPVFWPHRKSGTNFEDNFSVANKTKEMRQKSRTQNRKTFIFPWFLMPPKGRVNKRAGGGGVLMQLGRQRYFLDPSFLGFQFQRLSVRKRNYTTKNRGFRHFFRDQRMSENLAISRVSKRAGQELTSGPVNFGFFCHIYWTAS